MLKPLQFILCTVLLGLGGCTFAEMNSISRNFDISSNSSKLVDVKQRSILVSNHLDKDGKKQPIVCAEPSPDALTVLSAGISGQVQTPKVGGSLAATLSEAGASIGLRTQSITLLRDGFYRLCESYLSGAISGEEYDILQRRYQANMIALLAIEQLTGAVRPPAVVLASKSSADAGNDLTATTQKKAETEQRNVAIDAELAKLPAEAARNDQQKAQAAGLTKEKEDNKKNIAALDERIKQARAAVASSESSGGIEALPVSVRALDKDAVAAVSSTVERITLSVVEADYSPQMCFAYLHRISKESKEQKAFTAQRVTIGYDEKGTRETSNPATLADYCMARLAAFSNGQEALLQAQARQSEAYAIALREAVRLASSDKPADKAAGEKILKHLEKNPPMPDVGRGGMYRMQTTDR